jgi:U1 small nuclear ribonucleoprotein
VEFESSRDLKEAYKDADGRKINGRRILVDVERGRTVKNWKPRRLGGGLGGTRIGSDDVNMKFSGREPPRTGPGSGAGERRSDRDRERRGGDRDRGSRREGGREARGGDRDRGSRGGDRDRRSSRGGGDRDRDRGRDRERRDDRRK